MRSIHSDCTSTSSLAAQALPDVPLDKNTPCIHPSDFSDRTNCTAWRDHVARELLNHCSSPTFNPYNSDGYFDHETVRTSPQVANNLSIYTAVT